MAITAGTLTVTPLNGTTNLLSATAATGGTGPYTYQWYRSTTSGFTPGVGNLIAGATSLQYTDTGLIPLTQYYYKMIAIDTGHSNDPAAYAQVAGNTINPTFPLNQFAMGVLVPGFIRLHPSPNTVSVQIDSSQATPLYFGSAVKIVDSAYGVPKVVGCTANSDEVLGFINYDMKTAAFLPASMAEISMEGNCIYLYATGPIARGARVSLDLTTTGGVRSAAGNTGDRIVGWAYDKATQAGQLIGVMLETPSRTVV